MLKQAEVLFAFEYRSPAQKFRKDAPHGPTFHEEYLSHAPKKQDSNRQINRSCVVRKAEHDLRGTIPPGSNILRHEAGILSVRIHVETTCETEIANLELAERVRQFKDPFCVWRYAHQSAFTLVTSNVVSTE